MPAFERAAEEYVTGEQWKGQLLVPIFPAVNGRVKAGGKPRNLFRPERELRSFRAGGGYVQRTRLFLGHFPGGVLVGSAQALPSGFQKFKRFREGTRRRILVPGP
jgi:hypothetical protein